MNISRSGRIRKKSKYLTDSEFHTPRDSVIHGLSSLASKVSKTSSSPTLNTQNEEIESMVVLDEGMFNYHYCNNLPFSAYFSQ